MREENNDFIANKPPSKRAQSEKLQKLSGVVFFLSVFVSFVIVILNVTQINDIQLYVAGITFFLGCIVVLYLLNVWITKQYYNIESKQYLAITLDTILIMVPTFFLLLTLRLSEIIMIDRLVIMLPLFVAQIICTLFLGYVLPGLIDNESSDRHWAYLLLSYYISTWLTESFVIIHLSWFYVIAPLLFNLVIHWYMVLPGCCSKTDASLSFWVVIAIMILIYTLIAIPFTVEGTLTIIQNIAPITIYSGIQATVIMFS